VLYDWLIKTKKNLPAYTFHVNLNRLVDRRPSVLDDAHPPGFRISEEGRRLRESRLLTALF
jgi:hypothetical protein